MIPESDVNGALPSSGFARAYVDFARDRSDAPAAYHLPVALNLLAAALPVEAGVPWAPDPMRGNIWGLLVGPSGDRKTVAITIGSNVLREADASQLPDELPGSVEALGQMLHDNAKRLIIYREFGAFLSQTIRGYAKPLREKYTELYDGQPSTVVFRKQRIQIENPRVSLLCASTPAYLEAYTTPADWEGGFLARFLVIAARRERSISRPKINHEQYARMATHLRTLCTQSVDVGECQGFDDAAAALWDDWFHTLDSFPSGERLHGAVARAQNIALKTALLYAFDTGAAREGRGRPWYLPVDCLEPAIFLAEIHLRSIRAVNDHIAESDDMRDRQSVLRALQAPQAGALTLGEILSRARLLPRKAKEVLESLVEEQVAIVRKPPGGGTLRWQLRPREVIGGKQDAFEKREGAVARILRMRGVAAALEEGDAPAWEGGELQAGEARELDAEDDAPELGGDDASEPEWDDAADDADEAAELG